MPPEATEPDRTDAARAEWHALARLRDRVEAAAREVERLRAENAALARRLGSIQEQAGGPPGPGFALPDDGDPEALRAKIQAFIAAIDEALRLPSPVETSADVRVPGAEEGADG
ncbi:MAG TPA: hypothetical protein VD962_02100 [Rubricoccaceae bacterium]|nr:hypothetical protein [Rubricoccaceae bacterium]